jgi:hypothetical protein
VLGALVTALVVVWQSAPPATVDIAKVLSPYYKFSAHIRGCGHNLIS